MTVLREIQILIEKEIKLEWRNKYSLNGILLYTIGAVFICYLSFNVKRGIIHPLSWNSIFWIVNLFSALNAVSKSFSEEKEGRALYYSFLVRPEALLISKVIYNSLLLLTMSFLGYGFYSLVMGNPVQDHLLFNLNIFLATTGLASSLTLIAAIASKASSNSTLMPILGFPVILPILLTVIKISRNSIDGLERDSSYDELLILFCIDVIVFISSFILFPYLWRN